MRRQTSSTISLGWRFWHSRRGAVAPIVGVTAIMLFGAAGLVTDLGAALATRQALQASTDAAAMAGAQDINCPNCSATQPISTAKTYSSITGGLNLKTKVTATMVSGYPLLKCFKSTGISCATPSASNGIQVKQTATVPTTFARVLGFKQFTLTTTATASAAGGTPKPLNVMIILDTTASMNTADPNCNNLPKETCALQGVQTILTTLAPSVDKIGLMAFPGLANASEIPSDYNCNSTPKTAEYGGTPAPVYQIVPLSNDYRTSNSSTMLNPSSNLATAAGGNGSKGICAPGGQGTYFADAITAAQAALVAATQPNTQNVMILLSDGQANASQSQGKIVASKANNQCQQAVTAAKAAANAGTWVYSVAYDATLSGCTTDTGTYASSCATMQAIASDATKFYSDNKGVCISAANSVVGLISALGAIAQSLLPPRMLPDNTA